MLKKTCITFGYFDNENFNGSLDCYVTMFAAAKAGIENAVDYFKAIFLITKGVLKIVNTFFPLTGWLQLVYRILGWI